MTTKASGGCARGFTDRGLTEQLGARLEQEVTLRRRGLIDPAQEKLASWKKLSVEGHLAAFEKDVAHATPGHAELTMTRVRRINGWCGFASIGDIGREVLRIISCCSGRPA